MNPVELVSICVRLFAANLVLWAFTFMFSMVDIGRRLSPFSIGPSPLPVFLFGGAILLLLLSGAFLLWMFPLRVARFIVPKGIEGELERQTSQQKNWESCYCHSLEYGFSVERRPAVGTACRLGYPD